MTLIVKKRPQWLAAAWLRETGEARPAMEVLNHGDVLTDDLREALATWIKKGHKRKRGATKPRRWWREYPPKLARDLGLPTNAHERRAYQLICLHRALEDTELQRTIDEYLLSNRKPRRGKPVGKGARIVADLQHRLGVSKRTAQDYIQKLTPNSG